MNSMCLYGFCRYSENYGSNECLLFFGQPMIQNTPLWFPLQLSPEGGFKLTESSGNALGEVENIDTSSGSKATRHSHQQARTIRKKFKEHESQYSLHEPSRNSKAGFRGNGRKYLKKNTESNISNQVFSFLSTRSKSSAVLERLARHLGVFSAEMIHSYYAYMTVIKHHKRKYLNKKFLLALVRQDNPYLLVEGGSPLTPALPIELFCKIIRMMIHYYLTRMCPLSIVTSKKLDGETFMEHMHRRRQVYAFLLTECQSLSSI